MKDCKRVLNFSMISLRDTLKNVTLYAFLLVILCVLLYLFGGVRKHLVENGDRMNLWEIYIWFLSTRQSQLIYFLSILFLVGKIMNYHPGMSYYLLRMTRHSWISSQIYLVFFNVLGFNIFLLLCFCLVCGGQVTLAGEWSQASMKASQFSVEIIGMRPVVSVSFGLLQHNPNLIGGLTFLLSLLIGNFTGLIMLLFYLKNRPVYGGICVLGLWFLDIIIEAETYLRFLRYMSPYGLSRVTRSSLNYGDTSVLYAALFLLCADLLLSKLVCYASYDIDFVKME